jgi:Fe2+ transport system protein FeoA
VFSLLALRKSLKRKVASARRSRAALPVHTQGSVTTAAAAAGSCALAACATGSRATVLALGCGDAEACRLRALGLCEGASVSVVEARNCMLLDVRGARLALGSALTAGITVLPLQS